MNHAATTTVPAPLAGNLSLWIGRIFSGLVILFFLFDAAMKLPPLQVVIDAMAELGWPSDPAVARALGVLMIVSILLYAYSPTSLLGAILITGYCWHELYASDWRSAFDFYAGQFGWTKADAMDMGPMGTYQLFAAGGDPIGGMMNKPDGIPSPAWLFYFNVAEADATVARVTDRGGQILNGPHQVPGGSWIVQCMDPQGAMFALAAPSR